MQNKKHFSREELQQIIESGEHVSLDEFFESMYYEHHSASLEELEKQDGIMPDDEEVLMIKEVMKEMYFAGAYTVMRAKASGATLDENKLMREVETRMRKTT